MPIYPLIDGMVFREDFGGPELVKRNGGVVLGTPLANGRARFAVGQQINYNGKAASIGRLKAFTCCAVAVASAFTGTYRTIMNVAEGANGIFEIGLNNNSTQPYFYTGTALVVPGIAYSPGRRSIIWSYTGAAVTFYYDGVFQATVAAAPSLYSNGNTLRVGNASGPFTDTLRHLSVLNSAFDANQALDLHKALVRRFP